jgi:Zn-dependent metalloprotease
MIRKITLTGIMLAFVLCSFAKEYKKDALAYLQKNQTEIKLTSQDIAGLTVLTDYYDDFSQINRVWFQQNLNGIPLKNAQIGMHFKDGKLVHYTNSGVYDLK